MQVPARQLQEAVADEQAVALVALATAYVALDNPGVVASLLDSLQEAGTDEQIAALLARDPAVRAALDGPYSVARLLDRLRETDADEQAAALAEQIRHSSRFERFLAEQGTADQFRFGREADGTPATPWSWEDLDLWFVLDMAQRRNREATLHYGADGNRSLTGLGDRPVVTPYEIRDGRRIETTLLGERMAVALFSVDGSTLGARDGEAGYVNYEAFATS